MSWLRGRRLRRSRSAQVPPSAGDGRDAGPPERAALLAAVLGSVGDGVLVIDGDGRYVLMNPAAREILGVDPMAAQPWSREGKTFRTDGVTSLPRAEHPAIRALTGVSTDGFDMVVRRPDRPAGVRITVSARPLDPGAGVVGGGAVAVFTM